MKKLIFGNFKMFVDKQEAIIYNQEINDFLKVFKNSNIEVGIAPTFPILNLIDRGNLFLIAQNVSQHSDGAYTGEVSAKILKSFDVDYCLVGHSERRRYYQDTNSICNQKIRRLLEENIKPIYCVGETLEEFQDKKSFAVISQQLEEGLKGLSQDEIANIIIAYEPVWAIGTGINASAELANDVAIYILKEVKEKFAVDSVVIYGGSVNHENIANYLKNDAVSGVLVGGASKSTQSFIKLIKNCQIGV